MWLPLQFLMLSILHFGYGFKFSIEGKELESSKEQKEGTKHCFSIYHLWKILITYCLLGTTLDTNTDGVKDVKTQNSIQSVTLSKISKYISFFYHSKKGLEISRNRNYIKYRQKINSSKYFQINFGNIL